MKYDTFTSVRRRIVRSEEAGFGGRAVPFRAGAASLVRWLVALALALAAVWLGTVVVPAFGGALVAAVVGFVALWATPVVVVRGVVRVLEGTG